MRSEHSPNPRPKPFRPPATPTPATSISEDSSPEQAMPEHAVPRDLPMPNRRSLLRAAALFVLLLAALFVVGWLPYHEENARARADAAERSAQVLSVNVAQPKQSLGVQEVYLPCDIRANQTTDLFPRTTGYLKTLHVDIGDHVKVGQLLADLDTPEVDAQLTEAKASLAQAKANVVRAQSDLTLAERTLDRYKQTPAGAVAATDRDQKQAAYDDAVSALEQSKASVGVAEAEVQRLTVLVGFEKITAPFTGIITARNYDVGSLLSANNTSSAPLFRMVQDDPMRVFVSVPQVYAADVRMGEAASLDVRNYPGQEFKGTVARTASEVTSNTRTMTFELHFANPDGVLYAGMYGQAHVGLANKHPVLVIPTSALLFNDQGTQVAVVQNDRVHLQNIQIGRDMGMELEVQGLSPEDQVAANPMAGISEGQHVRAMAHKSKVAEQAKPTPGGPHAAAND